MTPAVALAAEALQRRLLLVRGRWRWVTATEAVLLGCMAALAVSVVGLLIAVAAGRSDGIAWVLAVSALVPAGGTAVAMAVHRWRAQRDLPKWAQIRAERHTRAGSRWAIAHPGERIEGEALRSGAEFALRIGLAADTQAIGSALLLRQTLAHAERQAAGLDADVEAIAIRCKRYGSVVAAALLCLTWVAVRDQPTWHRWWTGPARAEQPPREVGTLVGDSRLVIATPDYAAAVVGNRQEERAETSVLRGSHLTAHAESLPKLQVETVEVQPSGTAAAKVERVAVVQVPAGGVMWQRTVMEPLRYRYAGKDDEGNPVREAGWRQLAVLADQPPTAEISQPKEEIVVRSGQNLAIDGRIDDDIGLRQVELVMQRPATGIERRPVTVQVGAQHSVVHEVIGVDALQLRAGEVAEVHLEATDTNPFEGARKGTSAKLRVRMFSAERHHTRNLDELGKLADTWTLRLADRLEGDPAGSKMELAEALKRNGALATEEQRALEQLRALRQQLADDVQARPRSLADLSAVERQLSEVLADEARAVARLESTANGYEAMANLHTVQRHHALVIGGEEQAVAALSELAAEELGAGVARDSQALAETERNLLSTLEKMADSDAKPLQAEAERLMDQLEQQMERLAATGQQRQRLVPYEHVNAQSLQQARWSHDLGAQRSALAEVRALLKAGKTREALERMRALGAALRQVSHELQQGAAQELSEEDQALARLVRDLRHGIDHGLNGQGRLRDELRDAAEEADEARQHLLRQAHGQALPKVQQLLSEARDSLRSSRLRSALLRNHGGVERAREALDAAERALRGGQLDRALQAIEEAQDGVSGGQRTAAQAEGDAAGAIGADGKRLDQAATRLGQAAAAMRETLPEPSELLRPSTNSRVGALAPRQARLRNALERLRRQLADQGDAQPALQRQVGERLDHALQTQREVEDSMQRGDARRAFDQTAEVLDALERAAELLQQGNNPSQSQATGIEQAGQGGGSPVELRDGNQGDSNEHYREQLLRAMQQPEPGGWHERLQRYYKAIAR